MWAETWTEGEKKEIKEKMVPRDENKKSTELSVKENHQRRRISPKKYLWPKDLENRSEKK